MIQSERERSDMSINESYIQTQITKAKTHGLLLQDWKHLITFIANFCGKSVSEDLERQKVTNGVLVFLQS